MSKSDLIHIRVGKGMKEQMKKLIESGIFSTEAEIAREGIRHLLIRYLKEAGLDKEFEKSREKNAKKL
jgi:Arc/MetJ-type ribon-helix-helix transcriptional regulator